MSGTRCSTIRSDAVAAIKAATLDQQAGDRDAFTHLDVSRRPESAPERSFRAFVNAPPHRDELQTCDAFVCELTVEIYYALGNGIDDRMCDDIERIWWALETLQSRNSGINSSEPSHLGVEETPRNYVVRISVVIRYRLDSSVLS